MATSISLVASKKKQPEIMDGIETPLFVWINEIQLLGDSMSETTICEKAEAVYVDLLKKYQ